MRRVRGEEGKREKRRKKRRTRLGMHSASHKSPGNL